MKTTNKEKKDKLINIISEMFLEDKFKDWKQDQSSDKTNISAGLDITVFPPIATKLSEVRKIIVIQDYEETVVTEITRKRD